MSDEGNDSFGYEYDNDDYGGGEDEEEIEIENAYFEADDKKNSNPKDAMEQFHTVIMLEENRSEKKYTFQSLLNIILIKCRLQLYEDLSNDVTRILKAMDKVSKNDANDAINNILEALLNLEDQTQADKAIVKILDYLKEKNYEQLWLNASIRLCKIYLDRKEFGQFQNLIENIKESCRLPDGTDDMKKSSVLLEVYSLEINVHMQTMNIGKMREIYEKTKNISSAIADPRTMGIIKDTHGKMLMIEKDWENARLELFEAFKYYQEVGSSRAKSVLKYVVIVSVLSQSTLNPFDNVEAKVYREDSEIKLLDNLRTAYEQKNGKELIRIMGSQKQKIFDEPFIQMFEEDLMNIICLEMIVALAAPYKRMRFDYLQRELNLSEKQVETYLSKLILDGKLNGKIDLLEGFFENNNARRNDVEIKKNQALFHWIKALSNVNNY